MFPVDAEMSWSMAGGGDAHARQARSTTSSHTGDVAATTTLGDSSESGSHRLESCQQSVDDGEQIRRVVDDHVVHGGRVVAE